MQPSTRHQLVVHISCQHVHTRHLVHQCYLREMSAPSCSLVTLRSWTAAVVLGSPFHKSLAFLLCGISSCLWREQSSSLKIHLFGYNNYFRLVNFKKQQTRSSENQVEVTCLPHCARPALLSVEKAVDVVEDIDVKLHNILALVYCSFP